MAGGDLHPLLCKNMLYKIKENIYYEILHTIGYAPIESGGILGKVNDVISYYFFDGNGQSHSSEYIPNVNKLNTIIKEWYNKGILFAGIVHSHPNGYYYPSRGDLLYVKNLMEQNPFLSKLLFPIVTVTDSNLKMTFYEYKTEFLPVKIKIIP